MTNKKEKAGMEQRLKTIMANVLDMDAGEITDDSSVKTVGAWDSLKHMEIITAIEEGFEIDRLAVEEIIKMVSVAEIKNVLKGKGIDI